MAPQPDNGEDLVNFFWNHLERDLDILSKSEAKNVDDAATLVHLVLQMILTANGSAATAAQGKRLII